MFYVYEWYNIDTSEIFYVGKGCNERYKQTTKRNKLFQEYYKSNNCDSRIIKYFEKEEDAFKYENERILELKDIGQCLCNLDNGGKGGVNFAWTDEMKEYHSKYNPMKNEKQRKRMSKNNPMKNPDIAKRVGMKKKRKVVVGNEIFDGVVDVAKKYNVNDTAIIYWLDRHYSSDYKICYYYDERDKPFTVSIKNHVQNYIPVIVDSKKFNSIKEASKYINVSHSNLSKILKEGKTEIKGHTVRYANQQPS